MLQPIDQQVVGRLTR